ncbi:MAG: sigma-70 family RNA polymerase sigma factor [Cytophagaceae bacterium]|nr:MAG: sigma-70 family RNA polymerase sigma factor [Cytophagaceae bacterium]
MADLPEWIVSVDREQLSPSQLLAWSLFRTGNGDREAFRELYKLTSSKIFGICLRVCNDRGAAEDMLHEVYLIIWKRANTFDTSRGSAIAWMSAIARNRSIDWRRAQYKWTFDPIDGACEFADPVPLISEMMLQLEASAGLLASLALLQQCQREAIYGAFFGGLTHAEMADRQGVPVGTMKSWVRRGLAKLREAMDAAELVTQPTN